MQSAVVVGRSGFLGSHVADALSQADYAITVFSAKPSPYLRLNQQGIVGDILDVDPVSGTGEGQAFHLREIALRVQQYRGVLPEHEAVLRVLIDNYQHTHGLPYTILRYESLYGDRADRLNCNYRSCTRP